MVDNDGEFGRGGWMGVKRATFTMGEDANMGGNNN